MKNPNWKQANPADQLTVIRGSLEGYFSNWEDGIIDTEKFRRHFSEHLEQIRQLEPFLIAGKDKW